LFRICASYEKFVKFTRLNYLNMIAHDRLPCCFGWKNAI